MIVAIYVFLLLLMLIILYRAGLGLQRNGMRILSKPGLLAIMAYTLNEGLRFGRGIDYNIYGNLYTFILNGGVSDRDPAFVYLIKIFQFLNISYQGFVIFASFLFIFSVIIFLKNFRTLFPIGLPLFALFSIYEVESMVRWYIGFSFVLIGLSYMLRNKIMLFCIMCMLGVLFHFALFPIPILFYLIFKIRKPILPPLISIPLFFIIGFTFQTDFMSGFANYLNVFSFFSDRAVDYADNAESWLTGGFGGRVKNAFPGLGLMLFMIVIVWFGYFINASHKIPKYTFLYNLTLVGFLLNPISRQIELLYRYDDLFLIFKSLMCARIVCDLFFNKNIVFEKSRWLYLTVTIYMVLSVFKAPFVGNPNLFLYVWDKDNKTYDKMLVIWANDEDKRTTRFK